MPLFSLLLSAAFANIPRIESRQIDLSQASKVYLKPGLISMMEFPQNIIEVRVGNPNDLKVLISQVSPRELTLYFRNSSVSATNLIVRSDKRVYIFDVFSAYNRHQDFIKVRGSFGQPESAGEQNLIESIKISPSNSRQFNKTTDLKLIEKVTL